MGMPTPPKLHESIRVSSNEKMTGPDLKSYMLTNGFSTREFAEILGITPQALTMWVKGTRDISITNSRVIRLFIKYPNLIKEF